MTSVQPDRCDCFGGYCFKRYCWQKAEKWHPDAIREKERRDAEEKQTPTPEQP